MTDIFLCVDPGASQTKIIYQLQNETNPNYLLMPPNVEPISQSNIDFYFASQGWVGSPAPIEQAWLQVDDEIFVVGDFANRFDPEDRLQELKYENALYKVLAAIGVIRERHKLNKKKKLSVELAVLLPANEYNDRHRFGTRLGRLMSDFYFRGDRIKAKLERILVRPEGGGLAAISISRNGLQWFQEQELGVLMLGHRNVSGVYFKYGGAEVYDSPLIGFAKLLDSIVAMTSGLKREQLAEAVFEALTIAGNSVYTNNVSSNESISCTQHPDWKRYRSIKNLATARNNDLRQQELEEIVYSIELAIPQYWMKVSKWLDKTFPKSLDTVIVSGGAARFLEPEIERYFNCEPIYGYDSSLGERERDCYFRSGKYRSRDKSLPFSSLVWGTGHEQELNNIFSFKKSEQSINYRLVDAFGLFEQLTRTNYSSTSSNSVEEIEVG